MDNNGVLLLFSYLYDALLLISFLKLDLVETFESSFLTNIVAARMEF